MNQIVFTLLSLNLFGSVQVHPQLLCYPIKEEKGLIASMRPQAVDFQTKTIQATKGFTQCKLRITTKFFAFQFRPNSTPLQYNPNNLVNLYSDLKTA